MKIPLNTRLAIEDSTVDGFAVKTANEEGCALLVVAPGDALRNGNAQRIVRHSNIPVLVAADDGSADRADTVADGNETSSPGQPSPMAAPPAADAGTPWHASAYFAEGVSIAQYLGKAAFKIGMGLASGSPMLVADGLHNLTDVVQAAIVMASMKLTKVRRDGYHLRLRELETLTAGALGLLVLVTGTLIGGKAILDLPVAGAALRGLFGLTVETPAAIDRRHLWPLALLTSTSVLVSLATSWFQVKVGRQAKEAALVADGLETRGDAAVEAMTLVGVLAAYGLGWGWVNAVGALVVAAFLLHTGFGIFLPAWRSLLKKSLGADVEADIRRASERVPGILAAEDVVTYNVGSLAVCSITVRTHLEAERQGALRSRLETIVQEHLCGLEHIAEVRLEPCFCPPASRARRIAYACRYAGREAPETLQVVVRPEEATHLLIVDLVHEDPRESRTEAYAVEGVLAAFATRKHVNELRFLESKEPLAWDIPSGCIVSFAPSPNPEVCLGADWDDE